MSNSKNSSSLTFNTNYSRSAKYFEYSLDSSGRHVFTVSKKSGGVAKRAVHVRRAIMAGAKDGVSTGDILNYVREKFDDGAIRADMRSALHQLMKVGLVVRHGIGNSTTYAMSKNHKKIWEKVAADFGSK